MHLIDTASGETVTSGTCKYAMDSSEARSCDEFTDEDAALLREEIGRAIKSCAADLDNTMLSTPVGPRRPRGGNRNR